MIIGDVVMFEENDFLMSEIKSRFLGRNVVFCLFNL